MKPRAATCRNGSHKHARGCTGSPSCWEKETTACAFPLSGKREGQRCGRPLCSGHAAASPDGDVCPAHARFLEKRARESQ